MDADNLIKAIRGMLLAIENKPKSDGWVKDFLIEIKSTLEEQQDEIIQWETGQRQTSEHYNAYRQRGIDLYEKDQRIQELTEENERMKRIIESNAHVIDEHF